ncbi:TMP-TENI-domain-containing protein [Xylariaceae sp. FL0255]|nr:TMP-TENI-domain-containing protein [Xylariaceae sp. FL0255]
MRNKNDTDYSLYLVTDSTPAVLGANKDRDICEIVEDALRGGVSIVQYRDKTADTGILVNTAKRLHEATKKYGVPLLINDRVDVAVAVGCEGVHVGQDDMDLASARKILGPDKIIGVSVSSKEELIAACSGEARADYLGIGTVFATSTKKDTKNIIGVHGLQEILQHLDRQDPHALEHVKTVCIGGINTSNTSRVVWQSTTPEGKSVDGVAVVSAIMASPDPETAARQLKELVRSPPAFARHDVRDSIPPPHTHSYFARIITDVAQLKPLSHNMTNLVVQNFAANVALCVGASPIMSNYGEEGKDLAKLGGSLVINMGTVTPEGLKNYIQALGAYNEAGGPVVFDPVGAGATEVRRAASKEILGAGYIDVIKGNQSEILACLPGNSQPQQRGVDSGSHELTPLEIGTAVSDLAKSRRNIVVMTGKTDYVTDGTCIFCVQNGHEYLGMVTGTGCCLGTTISAMIAVRREYSFEATIAGLLLYNIAAENAAARGDVKGPGTFVPAFLDELYNLRDATVKGDTDWLNRAQIEILRR